MRKTDRRSFLKLSVKLAALMGLGPSAVPKLHAAAKTMADGRMPILWLQGQSCSGCTVSLLNTQEPGPASLLTEYVNLLFHGTLSTASGSLSMEIVDATIASGDFILLVEGSIPAGMPKACMLNHKPLGDIVLAAARKAKAVVAVGSCAAFGGIPAAENNPTGAISVPDFLKNNGVTKPTILLPGCPSHPDWMVGTLLYVHKFGIPPLDELGRPKMFFNRILHDKCPRFSDYERENFAKRYGDDGCLFKLGCLGPITHADCTVRGWNSRTNCCINAGAPCIGCASPNFARKANLPFYTKSRPRNTQEVTL